MNERILNQQILIYFDNPFDLFNTVIKGKLISLKLSFPTGRSINDMNKLLNHNIAKFRDANPGWDLDISIV